MMNKEILDILYRRKYSLKSYIEIIEELHNKCETDLQDAKFEGELKALNGQLGCFDKVIEDIVKVLSKTNM